MQGNGTFCTHPPEINTPVKLELQGYTEGFVNLVAILGDYRVCIACFRDGMYDPQYIPPDGAAKMGILLDCYGHMRSTVNP